MSCRRRRRTGHDGRPLPRAGRGGGGGAAGRSHPRSQRRLSGTFTTPSPARRRRIVWKAEGTDEAVLTGPAAARTAGQRPRGRECERGALRLFEGSRFATRLCLCGHMGPLTSLFWLSSLPERVRHRWSHRNREQPQRSFYIAEQRARGAIHLAATKASRMPAASRSPGRGTMSLQPHPRLRRWGRHHGARARTGRSTSTTTRSPNAGDAIRAGLRAEHVRAIRTRITNCFEGSAPSRLFGGPPTSFQRHVQPRGHPVKMHNKPIGRPSTCTTRW